MQTDRFGRTVSRRDLLKAGAVASIGLAAVSGSTTAKKPDEFDPALVDGTIVADAPEPTFRIDNRNATAAKVMLVTNGPSDGDEYTVGANQASFDPPEGKYVSVACGEVVTGLLTKRPQDDDWASSGFTGTATAPGCA
ncbi:hypothetical protein [Salinigranum marinum]|uniref:hypothetical protein n=1 Tax=Salinigranum marinum TaxID=1515595 RepID=UPI0029899F4C|nr:hypothetical protein [Salinigranum marinum]